MIRQLQEPAYFVKRELAGGGDASARPRTARCGGGESVMEDRMSETWIDAGAADRIRPRTSRPFEHRAASTRSTGPRTIAISPLTASAPTSRSSSPTALCRARSSNARCTTDASTSPPAKRRARRPASILRPIRRRSRAGGCSSISADQRRLRACRRGPSGRSEGRAPLDGLSTAFCVGRGPRPGLQGGGGAR